MEKIYLDLFIQDSGVGFVKQESPFFIPAKGSSDINLDITFNPQLVATNIVSILLGGLKQKDIKFTLKGYANLRSGLIKTTLPITYTDSLKNYL